VKCHDCDGGRYGYFQANGQETPCPSCEGHFWLPFWTPAEREGLKAMGFNFSGLPDDVKIAIRRYVAASRKVKEGK
jgi:hypothetical protein